MNAQLISYYEAIEKASGDMLEAARGGDWEEVCKLEGACALLIAQLKHASADQQLNGDERPLKTQLMQRILLNDAEIRRLAEPWLDDIEARLSPGMGPGKPTLH
jgi:flagellar protein FliT